MHAAAPDETATSANPVDYGHLRQLLAEGADKEYQGNRPFPHLKIDDFLVPDAAQRALREIESTDVPREKINYSTYLKYRLSDPSKIGPQVSALIAELNSPAFVSFLEKLTGIGGLVADPSLEGGGIHRIGTGGFLKVHSDFNFHRSTGMFRRLNILVYLNPDWADEWGGAIELWERDMSKAAASYPPVWNRAVIFSTTDESFHGHPDPLRSPADTFRNSIALYYYTKEPPADGYHFERSEMTNYQPRPGEGFAKLGKVAHLMHQIEIRHPRLRRVTTALKRLLG